jgi:HK97 family phage portal protein
MDIKDLIQKSEDIRQTLRDNLEKGLADRFFEADEPAGFQYGEGFVFGSTPPKKKSEEYLRAATGWVYSCVSAIADAVAKLNLRLYKINGEDVEEVKESPVLDLLYKVNKYQTYFDHIWLTQQYLELTGEAPWFIDRGESGEGEPENIMLLRPDRLYITQASEGETPVAGYTYKLDNGSELNLKPSEVLFLKYPDPINMFRGKGTLQAAATTVDIDTYSEEYNKRFFYNSARPDSILSTDQKLTPRQREGLRSDIKRLYSGVEKAHAVAVLESGLKWSPMALTQKDMDFISQQNFSRDKIFSIFRVPKPIVAVTDDVNLANAKIAEYVFSKWTIKPKMERVVAQLNEFFLPMFSGTDGMFISYDDPVPADVELSLKKYDSALINGWMTRNEIRELENLEDVGSEGDILYIPSSQIEIGKEPASPFGLGIKVAKSNKVKKEVITRSAGGFRLAKKSVKRAEAVKKLETKINQMAVTIAKAAIDDRKKKEIENARINFASDYIKVADIYEKAMVAETVKIFRRQKDQILKPEKAVDLDDYLLDEEDETKLMIEAYNPLIKKIVKDQGDRAALLAGMGRGAFDMATKEVQEYLKERIYKFSFEINEETNKLLSETLADGVAQGEGVPLLRKRVDELFSGMEKYRSERIARSEVIRASGFATTQAYEQSGVVEAVEWMTTNDDVTCEFCEPLDGKQVDLGKSFFKVGDDYVGSDGGVLDLSYENINFPPLHPNCRCTVVPVIK